MTLLRSIVGHAGLAILLTTYPSLAFAQAPHAATPEITALLDQAQRLYSSGKAAEAQPLFEAARAKADAAGDKVGEGIALRRLGNIAADQRQLQKADALYEQGLKLHQQAGDRVGEAYIFYSQGRARVISGQPAKGNEYLERALAMFRETKHKPGVTLALKLLGDSYASTNANQKALDNYLQVMSNVNDLPDDSVRLSLLGNTGLVYMRLFEPGKAVEFFQRQIALSKQIGDRRTEATALTSIGQAYRDNFQEREAIEASQQALQMWGELKDKAYEAGALQTLGNIHLASARFDTAREYFERALKGYRETNATEFAANVLMSMGATYRGTGEWLKSLECYQQAIDLYHSIGKELDATRTLSNIGLMYQDSGQIEKGNEYFLRALPILRKEGDRRSEASLLNNIGLGYRKGGNLQKALEYYLQSLPLRRETNDKVGEARSLDNIGFTYAKLGKLDKALEYLNQALGLCRSAADDIGTARTLDSLGLTFAKKGKPQKSLEYYREALAMRQRMGQRDGEIGTLTAMGDLEVSRNDLRSASSNYDQAIALAEKTRSDLGGMSESKAAYLQTQSTLYYSAMSVQLRLGNLSRAFELSQKTKARNLLDLLASGRVDLDGSLTAEERQREQDLCQQADAINAAMVKQGVENEVGSKKRYEVLRARLKMVESELQRLTDTLYARHPGLAQKRVARTTRLAELAKLLPEDTALLDYVVASKKDVRLFVVTKNAGKASLSVHRISADYTYLTKQASALRAACADPRKPYRELAQQLYDILVKPATGQLKDKARLLICPDGSLWDVPFAALLPPEGERTGATFRFLSNRYEIAYAYSATGVEASLRLGSTGRLRSSGILVAANPEFGSAERFGDLKEIPGQRPIDSASRPLDSASRPLDLPARAFDAASRAIDSASRAIDSASRGKAIPALPGTQREADALRKLFAGATVLTGIGAQETIFKELAGKFQYLHLATHGFVNDGSPLLSSVVFAKPNGDSKDDGFLTAREIYCLNLNAEMTVLSACNTARGENRTGEGVIGLTWALFVAGCPTQVVSQWSVDDKSTAMLMGRFYENLRIRKMGKAAALKEAETWLQKQNEKYRHPYYWAPFVLNGAWK